MTLRLVVASRNRKKVRELERLLSGLDVELCSLDDAGITGELREDGATFDANARQKAAQVIERVHLACLADDSGLEVDALAGAPGVHSARFAGEPRDDAANNAKLVRLLADVPEAARTARFRCVLAFGDPAGPLGPRLTTFEGTCEGSIGLAPRGNGGFGYDPHFVPRGLDRTLAELEPGAKDALSHRGQAVRAFRDWLRGYLADRSVA